MPIFTKVRVVARWWWYSHEEPSATIRHLRWGMSTYFMCGLPVCHRAAVCQIGPPKAPENGACGVCAKIGEALYPFGTAELLR